MTKFREGLIWQLAIRDLYDTSLEVPDTGSKLCGELDERNVSLSPGCFSKNNLEC